MVSELFLAQISVSVRLMETRHLHPRASSKSAWPNHLSRAARLLSSTSPAAYREARADLGSLGRSPLPASITRSRQATLAALPCRSRDHTSPLASPGARRPPEAPPRSPPRKATLLSQPARLRGQCRPAQTGGVPQLQKGSWLVQSSSLPVVHLPGCSSFLREPPLPWASSPSGRTPAQMLP